MLSFKDFIDSNYMAHSFCESYYMCISLTDTYHASSCPVSAGICAEKYNRMDVVYIGCTETKGPHGKCMLYACVCYHAPYGVDYKKFAWFRQMSDPP